jgi:large subunit ribosomal protein L19
MNLAQPILDRFRKKQVPNIEAGDIVRVHQKISEGGKERIQVFEGIVIATHEKNSLDATFTVRKIASGVGVERTYLIHSPNVVKVEFKRSSKVRRSKLYYLRDLVGKALRMKDKKGVAKDNWELVAEDEVVTEPTDEDIAEAVEADKIKQEEDSKDTEGIPTEQSQTSEGSPSTELGMTDSENQSKIGGESADGLDNQAGKETDNNDEQAVSEPAGNKPDDSSSDADQTNSGNGEGDKEESAE